MAVSRELKWRNHLFFFFVGNLAPDVLGLPASTEEHLQSADSQKPRGNYSTFLSNENYIL